MHPSRHKFLTLGRPPVVDHEIKIWREKDISDLFGTAAGHAVVEVHGYYYYWSSLFDRR